ncbi:hypothetical protein HK405_006186 [Cladochytrium tenue]|nr:hypothetical protein HK405_006186 [Cladochytrium tenue]
MTKVALAGSSGSLGTAVLQQLVAAGFEITALTRTAGKVPVGLPNVTEVVVNFENKDSLIEALRGHEAVVSTTGSQSKQAQLALIDAAVAAGVSRFVPSSFGSDYHDPENRALPVYADFIAVEEYLGQLAADNKITWTSVANNGFLDWGLKQRFFLDVVERRCTLWDGGDHLVSFTRLSAVGQAVVGILKHPDETRNRIVYIQEAEASLKDLVNIVNELHPAGADSWVLPLQSTKDAVAESYAALAKGQLDMSVLMGFLVRAALRPEASHFKKNDNDLLGVKLLSRVGLKAAVAEIIENIPGVL